MDDCLFCKIAKKEIPAEVVYEDDFFLAFLDLNPVNPGHTLLIPKEHYKNLYELPDQTISKMGPSVKKLAIAVKKSMSADGINIHMNNEKPAGQAIFHAHFHIIPRFQNDGYKLWHGKPYKDNEISEVAKKIRESL